MEEILFPRTDAGVAVQLVIVIALFGLAFVRVRHHRDARLLVAGLAVFTLGLFVLRASH